MDGRIALLIGKAEQHITHQRFAEALECIAAAEHLEPDNRSVRMLKELVVSLQSRAQQKTLLNRFFPRRIRKSFEQSAIPAPLSESEAHKRIRSLTGTADYHLSRGAVESAYESMMRAYALDPTSADVIACQQRVLPAWKKLLPQDAGTDSTPRTKPSSKKIQSSLFERLKNGKLLV